ncbi:FKBP-type peptidyl-prolyl cis-trans isomerase [Tolumonas osonensis]|uniref:Peptidyl-prolyl cis-trans isomerase n=1 Tax=Tolumonas osonensis TaxID=675874 RepID=A0A841GAY1_9GAMM|nr:FKBP-type peptidyl-prolyl cis-trans isomerase [Tolumonas osonensis]MBB6056228.1 FKBP-type peptidyl-prolyl cis-trans isomerase FklB [Tolumonas osonensis]
MSKFETTGQQACYGIGRQIGQQLSEQSFEGFELSAVFQGIEDAINNAPFAVSHEQIGEAFRILNETMAAEEAKRAETMKAAGAEFLVENAKRPEVKVTESGLQYEVLVAGSGKQPAASDKVRVHYHGTFTDGQVFDSSVQRGQPAEFPVGGVIAGWVEALQLMSEGAKWKLFIPHNLAYGERGAGSIPPFSTLVFEVELLNVLA